MNQLKYLLPVLLLMAVFSGCKQDNLMIYDQKQDNIFFNFGSKTDDSVSYTFAYTPDKGSDTIYLPVALSGNIPTKDVYFKVMVVDSITTAEAGLHYAKLADSFKISAGSIYADLPVVLYNKDTNLTQKSVALGLRLVASSDLGVQLPDRLDAKIIFANKLVQPDWWTTWMTNYSDEKFELFIVATDGIISMPSSSDPSYGLYAPQALYYRGLMDNLIEDPAGWIAQHPTRGYILEAQSDGTYYFYNPATPGNKIKVIYDSSAQMYYFVQKIGGYVTPD